jgi:predicted Zn-dependent protease with MMP-like domain
MRTPEGEPPTAADIEEIAARAFETISAALRKHATNIRIHVEDFPNGIVMREMALESPYDLLGLYQGVPISDRSVSNVRHDIDMITLYRRPLLDYWLEKNEHLEDVVRHVLIHEVSHHFGFSDDDMENIEDGG